MKYRFTVLLVLLGSFLASQGQGGYQIQYDSYNNNVKSTRGALVIRVQDNVVFLSQEAAPIQVMLDYNRKEQVTMLKFGDSLYKSIESFSSLPQPRQEASTENILGFPTKKAVFSAFSNTIETWYTTASASGPSSASASGLASLPAAAPAAYIPDTRALVLKQVINGNRMLLATKIEKLKNPVSRPYPYTLARTITAAEMEALKIRSRYEVLPVFQDERINFENLESPKSRAELKPGVTYRFSSGSVILKKVNISKWKGKDVSVYARLTSRSDGDAYDRTGLIFMIPESPGRLSLLDGMLSGADTMPSFTDKRGHVYKGMVATGNFLPAVEWMRFFTPFGVGHFNNKRVIAGYDWENKAYYKQDITDLFPSDADEVWVGAYIGNYDRGGHIVNLELDIYPGQDSGARNYIQPVFNTLNILEMSGQTYSRLFATDTLRVTFTLPASLKDPYLVFTTTGHGGWGGGDEFVPRLNKVLVNGQSFFEVVPWRTDCASYRNYNPASGNFGNGLSSSDLSRSNWCPGTITYPYRIPLHRLPPGEHEIQVVIPQGPDEGNSFSYWQVSGVVTGQWKP